MDEVVIGAHNILKSASRLGLAFTLSVAREAWKLRLGKERFSPIYTLIAAIDDLNPGELIPALVREAFRIDTLPFGAAFARATITAVIAGAEFFKRMTPGLRDRALWRELQNKLLVFYLFKYVDAVLSFNPTPNINWTRMLDRASALGNFFSLWATEGLGRYYALQHSRAGCMGLLLDSAAGKLSAESLIPLHTGMGLALAELALAEKSGRQHLAKSFVEVCQRNAHPQYIGATLEAMGLVARSLYPELIPILDRQFSEIDRELRAYFWHGVGRGTYFLPCNLLPCGDTPWVGYQICAQEPPDSIARENAMAGYAWALTLVNIRDPMVLAAFLEDRHATAVKDPALENGVLSAIVIWLVSTPKHENVASLLESPRGLKRTHFDLWTRFVTPKVRYATIYKSRPGNDIGQLFRYGSLRVAGV